MTGRTLSCWKKETGGLRHMHTYSKEAAAGRQGA